MCKHQVRLPNQMGKFKLTAFTRKDKNVEASGNNNNTIQEILKEENI